MQRLLHFLNQLPPTQLYSIILFSFLSSQLTPKLILFDIACRIGHSGLLFQPFFLSFCILLLFFSFFLIRVFFFIVVAWGAFTGFVCVDHVLHFAFHFVEIGPWFFLLHGRMIWIHRMARFFIVICLLLLPSFFKLYLKVFFCFLPLHRLQNFLRTLYLYRSGSSLKSTFINRFLLRPLITGSKRWRITTVLFNSHSFFTITNRWILWSTALLRPLHCSIQFGFCLLNVVKRG